jgi:hypothetical protein
MMAVFPGNRCRQSRDKFRLCATDDLFKAVSRQMVTLIDDHMAVFTDAIVNDTLADETLDDRNIQPACWLAASAADSANLAAVDAQKR